jgi:arabinose-5-phosphate isomerase
MSVTDEKTMLTSFDETQAQRALDLARETLDIEGEAIRKLNARLGDDDSVARAVALMLACKGRVVVSGIGKSGHIGRKIAATLASTGTPALFVHPAEAAHGDLGMVTAQDVLIAISYSGESAELAVIIPAVKRMGVPVIAMTGKPESRLAQAVGRAPDVSVDKEACPLNLAPTASTTVTLALGDALAVALLDAARLQVGRLRAVAPGRRAGPAPADPCARRDAQRRRGAARWRPTRC